ncbi:MAG TPA: response regulator [bacterium]|nr:response regulator [bacterium]
MSPTRTIGRRTPSRIGHQPFSILLVEDNLDHAELIRRGFGAHHIEDAIVHVRDGEEALDYLLCHGKYAQRKDRDNPHLILLDLRLPKIDGLEVLKVIKNTEGICRIPVVILTTSDAERDVSQAYDRRANSYVIKPLDFQTFIQLTKDLGLYWLGWNLHPC